MQGTIKVMRKDRKGFQLEDGQWYSGYNLLSVNKGDTVEFNFTQKGQYKNIDGPVTVVGGQQQAPAQPAKGYSSPVPRADDTERQRMIVRQNALTNAVTFALGNLKKGEVTTDTVIQIAQEFEYYTSGDLAKDGPVKEEFVPE